MGQKIKPGDKIPVRITAEERSLLLGLTLPDHDYLERLEPAPGRAGSIGRYTLDELEDLLGNIAAEANHAEDRQLQIALDKFYDRLAQIQRSHDDGN